MEQVAAETLVVSQLLVKEIKVEMLRQVGMVEAAEQDKLVKMRQMLQADIMEMEEMELPSAS